MNGFLNTGIFGMNLEGTDHTILSGKSQPTTGEMLAMESAHRRGEADMEILRLYGAGESREEKLKNFVMRRKGDQRK